MEPDFNIIQPDKNRTILESLFEIREKIIERFDKICIPRINLKDYSNENVYYTVNTLLRAYEVECKRSGCNKDMLIIATLMNLLDEL